MRRWSMVTAALFVSSLPATTRALDKQGSAHAGSASEAATGFEVSGALTFGSALYNRSYAARPDNTGLALFRYAAHVDVDVVGPRLSIPLDLNVFTARRRGLAAFAPTELDVIGGVTTTWPLGPGSLELGARVEHDRPVDRGCEAHTLVCTQTYADVRSRYLYSLAALWPGLGRALRGGDVSGAVTLGLFAYNPTYAARPDNSGRALVRFAPHVELSILDDVLSYGLDFTTFTDRSRALRPSELDLTQELIVHLAPWELHLAYERDLPVDRGGTVQSFVYALCVWNFHASGRPTKPLEARGSVLSP